MTILDYTTYDEIRATLGVSATELADTVLSQTQYAVVAVTELEDVNTGIPDLYTTISAISSGSRTVAQQRFYDYSRLFVTYAIARNLLTSLPLFSVARLTDGRAEFERQRDIFEDVRLGVESMFNIWRLKLTAANKVIATSDPLYTTAVFAYTASTGLGTDPVTGS